MHTHTLIENKIEPRLRALVKIHVCPRIPQQRLYSSHIPSITERQMNPNSRNNRWIVVFSAKIVAIILILNLIITPILWLSENLQYIPIILTYESLFTLILGILQILSSYIYRENSLPSRWGGSRTGWFNFKKFAKMEAKERKKYRQEGQILFIIGLMFLLGIITAYSYLAFF